MPRPFEVGDRHIRREVAVAQADLLVDVLSALRGRYEDDDLIADQFWLMRAIPKTAGPPGLEGILTNQKNEPAFGWRFIEGKMKLFFTIEGPSCWPITRRELRRLATAHGVRLPSCHATAYLFCGDVDQNGKVRQKKISGVTSLKEG